MTTGALGLWYAYDSLFGLGEYANLGTEIGQAQALGEDVSVPFNKAIATTANDKLHDAFKDDLKDVITYIPTTIEYAVAAAANSNSVLSFFGLADPQFVVDHQAAAHNAGTYNFLDDPTLALNDFLNPGGVALDKSASVLLPINNITGGTYDPATGQIILFGKQDSSASALPAMNLDDLAVVVRAKQLGTFPVVSIEEPIVSNPPEWPGRNCDTVRYGPYFTDSLDGQQKVLDVASKTHFGWVMFEADRLMKSLVLGVDNRTQQPVSSSVPGYTNLPKLLKKDRSPTVTTAQRFWFEPNEIVVQPSADGHSMQITKASMKLSTEAIFASGGQVEGIPEAEYFANWFTTNYDAIAEEQVSLDASNQPHKIYKELKQLAYLAGVVKWIDDNHIPVDLAFLRDYQPLYDADAPALTPLTSVRLQYYDVNGRLANYTVTGGVTFCHDLTLGVGGNPAGTGAVATASRPNETTLGWTFSDGTGSYNATAFSVDRTQKDGGSNSGALDAQFRVKGERPLTLGRYFDSFNILPTPFGWGWKIQPYALEFKQNREVFSICHQTYSGYGEVWFRDRASKGAYKFVPGGTYDKAADPLHLASRFNPTKDILVYQYQSQSTPGQLFSDNATRMTMRLDSGELLDFDFNGLLTRTEDRDGNGIDYTYDSGLRLVSIGQAGGRVITLAYDTQNRVASASLPGNHSVKYFYDTNGNLISAQADAAAGQVANYAYDLFHNLAQVQDEIGKSTSTQTYDNYGRIVMVTQPGVSTPFTQTYNLATRTSLMTGPNGASGQRTFNENSDVLSAKDALGYTTAYTYNAFRNVTSITSPDHQTRQYYLDSSGHRMATVMPSGRVDGAFFDQFGHPLVTFHEWKDANFDATYDANHIFVGDVYYPYPVDFTQYTYDGKGNRTGVTDANSHTRTFGYDSFGNLASSKDARGQQTTYSVDTNSRPIHVTDPLGAWINTSYDDHDNVTQISTSVGSMDYAYNAKSQVVSVTTGDAAARHTYAYTYDAKGAINTVTDPNQYATQYSYDERGNLIQITHDNVVRFTYEYDGLNRLTATHYTGSSGGAQPVPPPASVLPTVSVQAKNPTVVEGVKLVDGFVITRSGGSTTKPLTVNFVLKGTATSGLDYRLFVSTQKLPVASTSVTIPAGATSVTVSVKARPDLIVEGDEKVTMKLSAGPSYLVGTQSKAKIIIQNKL